MTMGWIKLIKDEVVIERCFYAGKLHRNRIISSYKKICEEMDIEMIVQIAPNLNHQGEETYLNHKEFIMKPGQRLREKTNQKKHYDVKEGPVKEDKPVKVVRPDSQYSNHNNISQYFD